MGNYYFYKINIPKDHNFNNYIFLRTEFGDYKIKVPKSYNIGDEFFFKIYIDFNVNPFDLSLLKNTSNNYYDIGD